MKCVGLDGKQYNFQLVNGIRDETSSYHERARKLLKLYWPMTLIYEEVFLPGSTGLYADFFIPSKKVLVEVHGEQHYEANSFFGGEKGFAGQKIRDSNKQRWCNLNNYVYIELPYNEDNNEWRRRIQNSTTENAGS